MATSGANCRVAARVVSKEPIRAPGGRFPECSRHPGHPQTSLVPRLTRKKGEAPFLVRSQGTAPRASVASDLA